MNNKFESFKDFLYEAIDYFLILGIIIIVAGIIGWRLDLLFTETNSLNSANKSEMSNDSKNHEASTIDKSLEKNGDKSNSSTANNNDLVKNEHNKKDFTPKDPDSSNIDSNNKSIEITIPAGSNSSSIGEILKEEGIIDDSSEFILKSEEMNLSTKLKSGTFDLYLNDNIENVLLILTK